jgi:hypothetical protein
MQGRRNTQRITISPASNAMTSPIEHPSISIDKFEPFPGRSQYGYYRILGSVFTCERDFLDTRAMSHTIVGRCMGRCSSYCPKSCGGFPNQGAKPRKRYCLSKITYRRHWIAFRL